MAAVRYLVGFFQQTAADTNTSKALPSTLSDSTDEVIKILRVELEFEAATLYTWTASVDSFLAVNLSNESVEYSGVVARSTVCRTQLLQHGTALSTTDMIIKIEPFVWEPPPGVDVYLYNEFFYVNAMSVATGVANTGNFRIAYEKVKISSFVKAALKSQ